MFNRHGTPPSRSQRAPRWMALGLLCAAILMVVIDSTIVSVAIPVILSDLHLPDSSFTWVINGYLLTFGGLLLISGYAGDCFGRKRMFLAGVVIFTIASLLGGLA